MLIIELELILSLQLVHDVRHSIFFFQGNFGCVNVQSFCFKKMKKKEVIQFHYEVILKMINII